MVETVSKYAWDKGQAVRALIRKRGKKRVPIFLGDDVTDEDAFAIVKKNGVAILVSNVERKSKAEYRLRGLWEVERALLWIARIIR